MSTTHTYTPKHTPAPRPDPDHPRPWHREAVFGEGTRRVLSARERNEFGHMLGAFARAGLILPGTVWTGLALRDFLDWTTGQCDPSHGALGQHVRDHYGKRSDRTVERDLCRLRDLGAVTWEQRLVRAGWRSEQTSNAYCLHPDADGRSRALPVPLRPCPEQLDRVGPRTPWARPVPTCPASSNGAAERGSARMPSADRTVQLSKLYASRRDAGFSDTVSVGSEQPATNNKPSALEAALTSLGAAVAAEDRRRRP